MKGSQNPDTSLDKDLKKIIKFHQNNSTKMKALFNQLNREAGEEDFEWLVESTSKRKDGSIMVKILETNGGIPTSGGSVFTFLQTSAHTKDFCPVTDYFNGTYIVSCLPHEDNTVIKGDVQFVNFTLFMWKYNISEEIFYMTVNENHGRNKYPLCDDPERGYWIHRNNSWHWFTGSHMIPKIDGSKLETCLRRYSRVSLSATFWPSIYSSIQISEDIPGLQIHVSFPLLDKVGCSVTLLAFLGVLSQGKL